MERKKEEGKRRKRNRERGQKRCKEDGHNQRDVNRGERRYGERHSGTDKDYWVG